MYTISQNNRFSLSFLSEMPSRIMEHPMGSAWEVPDRVLLTKLRRSQEERRVSSSGYLYEQETPCFSSLFPVSSLCQRRLVYILYESWLLGVFHVYTTLKLPLTLILGSYVCGIHCITMIYILHIYVHLNWSGP